ncbi:Rcd1-domain-containing protein [Cytidiella melzeri]|nr:Rcd1-domain-containing protein [Cytidiella melzeri]
MAGLVSPKPVSYMQHTLQYNQYQRAIVPFSESPSNVGPGLTANQAINAYGGGSGSPAGTVSMHEEQKIYGLVIDLLNPGTREGALLELSKKREQYDDLALVLWHSFGIMPALLQEIVSVYPQLSPPNLTAHISNRVCNALALLQCVASHPETRQLFLNAHIPLFLYPFLNTTSKTRPFEYLRLTSLGVIGALVKQNDNNTVIHFLLSTEIIPLCLRIMETGSELSKTVAIFIVQKILLDETGLTYICHTYERFYAVGTVLSNMVNQLVETQAVRLLKHVVRCYLRLSDNLRAREALRACLPEPLRDQTFAALLKVLPFVNSGDEIELIETYRATWSQNAASLPY